MLKDQINQPDEAIKLYLEAEKTHPKDPAVYNNLAVHFIRYNMVPEAVVAARHAVELRPQESAIATILRRCWLRRDRPRRPLSNWRDLRRADCALQSWFPPE